MTDPSVIITVRVPWEIQRELEFIRLDKQQNQRDRVTLSDVIREAITTYLQGEK